MTQPSPPGSPLAQHTRSHGNPQIRRGVPREVARPPVPYRRREGFLDRRARPMMAASRAAPRPYVSRSRFGFQDVPGRKQEPPIPRIRAAERRYSADLRPVRWPQVMVMNVQPSPPALARPIGPGCYPMAPRRAAEFPSATASVNLCFGCGQTGGRLMNWDMYLQECARDPLGVNRCFACNAVGLRPVYCRSRLYFATPPYPQLELNKDGTSYFIRCGLPMPRWYRPELLVGPARAAAPAVPNPAAPEYLAAYAVHSAAVPRAATPALPAPADSTPAGARWCRGLRVALSS